jgi:hypothetical protein
LALGTGEAWLEKSFAIPGSDGATKSNKILPVSKDAFKKFAHCGEKGYCTSFGTVLA